MFIHFNLHQYIYIYIIIHFVPAFHCPRINFRVLDTYIHIHIYCRKNEVKKVVCIPALPPTSSRPGGGEVIPSDLWAWRKYGQKPIKGSPYPRCSAHITFFFLSKFVFGKQALLFL